MWSFSNFCLVPPLIDLNNTHSQNTQVIHPDTGYALGSLLFFLLCHAFARHWHVQPDYIMLPSGGRKYYEGHQLLLGNNKKKKIIA